MLSVFTGLKADASLALFISQLVHFLIAGPCFFVYRLKTETDKCTEAWNEHLFAAFEVWNLVFIAWKMNLLSLYYVCRVTVYWMPSPHLHIKLNFELSVSLLLNFFLNKSFPRWLRCTCLLTWKYSCCIWWTVLCTTELYLSCHVCHVQRAVSKNRGWTVTSTRLD